MKSVPHQFSKLLLQVLLVFHVVCTQKTHLVKIPTVKKYYYITRNSEFERFKLAINRHSFFERKKLVLSECFNKTLELSMSSDKKYCAYYSLGKYCFGDYSTDIRSLVTYPSLSFTLILTLTKTQFSVKSVCVYRFSSFLDIISKPYFD